MICTPPLWLVFRKTGQWRYGRFVRLRQPSRPAKLPLPGRIDRHVKGTVLPTIFEPSLDLSQLMLQFYAMINWTFW